MKKKATLNLSLLLIIPVINILYSFLNNDNRGYYSLVTEADKAVPLIKAFVLPYLMWYPFIFFFLVYFFKKDVKIYYTTLFSLIIGYLICYFIFFLFQTYVPRPVIAGNSILDKLLNIVYMTDKPFNCFPSIHVMSSFIIVLGAMKLNNSNNKIKAVVVILAVSIILSTQFIKQHVLLDVFSGILLGHLVYKISDLVNWEDLLWEKKPFSWLMMKKKLET